MFDGNEEAQLAKAGPQDSSVSAPTLLASVTALGKGVTRQCYLDRIRLSVRQ